MHILLGSFYSFKFLRIYSLCLSYQPTRSHSFPIPVPFPSALAASLPNKIQEKKEKRNEGGGNLAMEAVA